MSASFLNTLRAGPPPPKVVLLPDGLFFTRPVPVAAGATPAEAAAQVELALEAVSPFPLAQLYYGFFWAPGAELAFVFAAYRRRFTSDQTAAWSEAELVLPAFAALLGAKVEPATTVLLASAEGLTAIHWAAPAAPSAVLFRPFPPPPAEETEETAARLAADRARLRDELLRSFDGSRHVIELETPPAADSAVSDREVVFRSGDLVSTLPAPAAAALDVRDKGDLAALRGARRRDLIMWRIALGCAAAFGLLILGELALQGGKQWQVVRVAKQRAQQPLVDKITASNDLAKRIDDIATKRLLPLEMITVVAEKKPADVRILRSYTKPDRGLYTVFVDVQTTNPAQVSLFQTQLEQLPSCERVESTLGGTRGGVATTTFVVTFKPDAIKPAPPTS